MTVEQLLHHTGGLGMANGVAGAVQIHQGPDALDRRVAELLSPSLAGHPGEDFTYSNAGVAMGYIGSSAADLAAFMQAHLHGHPDDPIDRRRDR